MMTLNTAFVSRDTVISLFIQTTGSKILIRPTEFVQTLRERLLFLGASY